MTEKQRENLKRAAEGEIYSSLQKYALRLVHNYAIAEEFTQEAFLRLCEEIEKKNGTVQNERAWLYKTTRNMIFDFLRRQKKRKDIFIHLSVSTSEPCAEQVTDAAEKKEAEEMLMQKLDQLSERHREAVRLKFQEKLTYDEIAIVMSESRSTVSRLLSEAIQKLREMMRVEE